MSCDICGSNKRAFLTELEGARVYVCEQCNPSKDGRVKFEKKVFTPRPKMQSKPNTEKKEFKPRKRFVKSFAPTRYKSFELADYDLVENYGGVLRKAREDKNITIEDMATKIREQPSYLIKIEQGKLKPNDKILLKLYDFLGVNLVRPTEQELADAVELANSDTNVEQKLRSAEAKPDDLFTSVTYNNKRKIVL